MSLLGPISTLGRWRDEVFNADFLSGTVPSDYVHTRAGAATYVDAGRVIRQAAANAPRIDFDPRTGRCRGLLLEAAATNRVTQSEFKTTGTAVGIEPVTLGWGRGFPATGIRMSRAEDGNTIAPSRTVSVVEGETDVLSAFVRMEDRRPPVIGIHTNPAADFSIVAGNSVTATYAMEDWGDGIFRVYGWRTHPTSSTTASVGVYKYGVHTRRRFEVTGLQFESGSVPTSYIVTGAAAAARAADSGSFAAPWYVAANGGTLLVEFVRGPMLPTGIATVAAIFDDGTNNNRAGIYLPNSADIAQFVTVVDGATIYSRSAAIGGNAPTSIAAISFDGAGATSRINGVLPGSDVAVSSLPTGVTRLRTAAISRSFHLRTMRYYSGRRDLAVLTAR